MELREALGTALRRQRKAQSLSQEAFTTVSSRTYISQLERGLKSPTLEKVEELAKAMGVHPLTLLTECFSLRDQKSVEDLFALIQQELASLRSKGLYR
jgi:transcriptional regulator with XRE-family HTH domain